MDSENKKRKYPVRSVMPLSNRVKTERTSSIIDMAVLDKGFFTTSKGTIITIGDAL